LNTVREGWGWGILRRVFGWTLQNFLPTYQITGHHIPEDKIFISHHRVNLGYYLVLVFRTSENFSSSNTERKSQNLTILKLCAFLHEVQERSIYLEYFVLFLYSRLKYCWQCLFASKSTVQHSEYKVTKHICVNA
jgi:hypothetical protein